MARFLWKDRRDVAAVLFFLADDVGPVGVEELAAWFVGALVGVGTEEVALGLQQVGG